jgi:hypothetical protein
MLKIVTEEANGLVSSKTWKKQLVNKLLRSTKTSRISLPAFLITKMLFKSRFIIMNSKTLKTSRDLRSWFKRSLLRSSLMMRNTMMLKLVKFLILRKSE